MIPLAVIAETATTLTVGWQPVAGALGYEFLVDGVRKSNTWDPTVKQVKFGKPSTGEHTYSVLALSKLDQGDLLWPAVVPTLKTRVMYSGQSAAQSWPGPNGIPAKTGFTTIIGGADDPAALAALRASGGKMWAKAGYFDNGTGQFSMSDAQALALAQNIAANWSDVVTGWYVADEPTNSAANRAKIQARAQLLKSAYPVETLIAYYDAGSVGQWKGVVDAFALDIYPSRFNWNFSLITQLAAAADAAGLRYYGISGCDGAPNYPMPTPSLLQQSIDTWDATKQVGWGVYAWDAPGQLQNSPALLAVLKANA